jgi:hypothetical protein
MMNFFARYAICALPKEETRRILNAYAAKRWDETRSLPDTILRIGMLSTIIHVS